MFLIFQSELTSSSSLKAVEVNTDVRHSRITLNYKYLKTRVKNLK